MKSLRLLVIVVFILLASVVLLMVLPEGVNIRATGNKILVWLVQNTIAGFLMFSIGFGAWIIAHYFRKFATQGFISGQSSAWLSHFLAAIAISVFLAIIYASYATAVIDTNVQISQILSSLGFHVPYDGIPQSLLVWGFVSSFIGYSWKNLSVEIMETLEFYGDY